MGTSTRGIVLTGNLDPFRAVERVEEGIGLMFTFEYGESIEGRVARLEAGDAFPTFEITRSRLVRCTFTFRSTTRVLWMFFNCHSDYKEQFPDRTMIIFHLGCTRDSVEIMERVLEPFVIHDGEECWMSPTDEPSGLLRHEYCGHH